VAIADFIDLLACPQCAGALGQAADESLVCRSCAALYPISDGIPALRLPADERSEVVRAFYSEAPFPGYPPRDNLSSLRARAARSEFSRLLDNAIPGDARILELGCGTGQMSLYLATADRMVVGCDLTRASLTLGADAARRYRVSGILFIESDLRNPGLRAGAFDVVYSSGVLHHTPDPPASFAALARLVKPGGFVVLGLYNVYARLPLRLRRAVARLSGFRFIPWDPVLRDRKAEPERRRAWLRDQYQHPEEHRHTLAEVQGWFQQNGIEYLRAYPNTLIGAEPLSGGELFTAADDNWGVENWLQQLGWAFSLGYEGGLFVTLGRRTADARS
jgi:SAM-dependent methyltransferase